MFWLARRSAHITRTLKSGVWEGLPQETSAKAVTAVICGLGNVMSSSRERGVSDSATVEAAMKVLEEKKLDSAGVYGQLMSNWENLKFSEGVCEELLEERGLSSLRADTVGAETVELYCSFFDAEDVLNDVEMHMIVGDGAGDNDGQGDEERKKEEGKTEAGGEKELDSEFEQINDDLFARKSNKYMVFNGAGKKSWSGSGKAITNTSRINVEAIFNNKK